MFLCSFDMQRQPGAHVEKVGGVPYEPVWKIVAHEEAVNDCLRLLP